MKLPVIAVDGDDLRIANSEAELERQFEPQDFDSGLVRLVAADGTRVRVISTSGRRYILDLDVQPAVPGSRSLEAALRDRFAALPDDHIDWKRRAENAKTVTTLVSILVELDG